MHTISVFRLAAVLAATTLAGIAIPAWAAPAAPVAPPRLPGPPRNRLP